MNSSKHNISQIPPAAISAIEKGSIIEAIKIVREDTGMGLKEAKDFVDQYIKDNPSI